jgi:hypothetical protein
MRKTDILKADQSAAARRDNLDRRVVRAGWGATLRMITLRIGSAYADRVRQPDEARSGRPLSRTRRAAHWVIGLGTAALAAYAHAHGAV